MNTKITLPVNNVMDEYEECEAMMLSALKTKGVTVILQDSTVAKDVVTRKISVNGVVHEGVSETTKSAYIGIRIATNRVLERVCRENGIEVRYTPTKPEKQITKMDYVGVLSYSAQGLAALLTALKKNGFSTVEIEQYAVELSKQGKRLTVKKVAEKFFNRPKNSEIEIGQTDKDDNVERLKVMNKDWMESYRKLKELYTEESFLSKYGSNYKSMADWCKFAPNPEAAWKSA